jgi:hypothetical protein
VRGVILPNDPPHVVYLDAERWATRTERAAERALARYLAGKLSAAAWVRLELRAHKARGAFWAASAAMSRAMHT